MSAESSKPTNRENLEEIIPTSKMGSLNFESLSRSILNDSRKKSELSFKHQTRNPFLKEKRNMQDQAMVSLEPSDASNNTKAPNVFASPHFRTRINATRLSFKEFQKNEVNNLPSLSAAQNHIDQPVPLFASLFSKKASNEITNEPFILNLPNFFSKESILERENLNQGALNQGNSLDNKKDIEHSNQELSIHDKSNDTFNQVPSIQEKHEKSSNQEACVECSLLDNTSPQSAQQSSPPLLNNDSFQIDGNEILMENTADIPKQNDKYIIENPNIFNESLPKNDQNFSSDNNSSITRNNSDKNFSFPGGKPNSSSKIQPMQGSNTNNQQPKLKNDIKCSYFHDKINSSNNAQIMTNLNKDNNIFPVTEHDNSEIKNHLNNDSNDNELNLIVGTIQRWKDEVIRRDCHIEELNSQIFTLRDILEHKEHTLSHCRERMFLVDSMVKRQHSYTERNRERINNIKTKYSFFRNLLCNMSKNIEEMCNQKERIEKEVESMRLGFSKLTTKHKSSLNSHAAISQTQQAQLAQITEFNGQLNNIVIQLRQDIQEIDSKASHFSSELDAIRMKLDHLLDERENERSVHAEEFQKLKLKFEHVEEDNRNLVKSNKENMEKIVSLTANIGREIESTQLECTRLNSIIKEKDERVAQLNIAEKERDGLKVELNQAKDLAEKDLHLLRQEMEIMRAQHATDLKCVESKFREDNYRLQNDFHNERCQLEAEWREERNRLESECREEHTHRLSLEGEYQDERSERFRIETELSNSEQKIEELSKANDIYNLRIAQLESRLSEIDRHQTDNSTVAVGTADILGLDLQIEHNRITSELNRENFDNKKKIEELISELKAWKSKSSLLESQLISLNLKYDELQNEHSKTLVEISNNYLQSKETMDQALNRAANDYQDMTKRTSAEHENEIRKRDCKIREVETKEAFLTEEIQVLKSKLSKMDECNKSLQRKSQLLQNSLKNDVTLASGKTKINIENRDSVTSKLSPFEENSEILRNEQHYHNARRLLTLTEIDAMILESTSRNISRLNDVPSKVNNVQKFNNNRCVQSMGSNSNNTLTLQETECISHNVTIRTGHNNNDVFDSRQNSNNVGDVDEWLSPSTNLRSKRRKRDRSESVDNFEPIERLSARSTNISMNANAKEVSKLGARFRFSGKSKVRRRFTIGEVNGKE